MAMQVASSKAMHGLPGCGLRWRARCERRVDDGQTNSFLFDLSVWPSSAKYSEPATADSGRVDDGQTNSDLLDLSVWPSNVVPYYRISRR